MQKNSLTCALHILFTPSRETKDTGQGVKSKRGRETDSLQEAEEEG